MNFRKYNHVERLTADAVEGLLDGTITYSPKLDGTNASMRWDNQQNCIAAFSRNRRLSANKDNAGFYAWATSDDPEAKFLRNLCFIDPTLIFYGEWMGDSRFVGNIKDYNQEALGKFWLFDVYDTSSAAYYIDQSWRRMLDRAYNGVFPWYVPYNIMENPTLEKIQEAADNNFFLLDHANHPGEGIVIRRHDFVNKYGRYEIGKYVRDEYQQNKSKPKKTPFIAGEVEQAIVNEFVTDAELGKTVAKVCLACDSDKFNNQNGKMIGMMLNLTFNDAILDEMSTIIKKFKSPTIDFRSLRRLCDNKVRKYIGLI